ncbi:saccharopine dehydrogenase NADP-binding domain-containing protein [Paenibacillus daejeonensis]|uniref:saccharopine dehydrogenase NADP-binding domain-containing protein n=1 Tax=Paenibacillus daejeonensis TaxID=135193 RepID=UPI0003701B4D|nr:saccharopine dehydrogenase NADP-binding domain-containing protein [Paenibacillus daejeonensis]
MKKNIVVIGGYGHVGGRICQTLAQHYPGQVIAAGRSLKRAEAFCASSAGTILPLALDVAQAPTESLLQETGLIIMCLDQQDTRFAQACLARGIHYIDISADYGFLSQVEALHDLAAEHGASAWLSVGLAPGLTNLLARLVRDKLDDTSAIDITIMLGLGDAHGKAALEWTLDNAVSDFETGRTATGDRRRLVSLSDGRTVNWGNGVGRQRAYRFNFADQHILPDTLEVPEVATRLSLDPGWMTGLLAAAKRLGLLLPLRLPFCRSLAVRAFGGMRMGQPLYALHVQANGHINGQPASVAAVLRGRHESEVTALTAAALALEVCSGRAPGGVRHIEQGFTYPELAHALEGVAHLTLVEPGR